MTLANATPARALVWDENPSHAPKSVYPIGLRGAIAEGLTEFGEGRIAAKTACQDDPSQGITEAILDETEILIWWGHIRQGDVSDATTALIRDRALNHGLGLIFLHSSQGAKPLRAILGAQGHVKGGWREDEKPEEITVCAPRHPIAQGISNFTLDAEEMYGAPYDVPPPSCVILQSYFPAGGEFFPSGIAWTVGKGIDPNFESGPGGGVGQGEGIGRVFYFRPGHETVPTYYHPMVRKVLVNATLWAAHRI